MIRRTTKASLAAVCLLAASGAYAGPYSDDLGKCLVNATTKGDRETLVRWMFAAAALHPAVKATIKVSQEQSVAANKAVADLFMRLLTKACNDEAQKAIRFEGGTTALGSGFQILGQVAGQELFANAEVTGYLQGLGKYLDEEKLRALVKPPAGD